MKEKTNFLDLLDEIQENVLKILMGIHTFSEFSVYLKL